MAERCNTLTRLAANGNGEVKCIVLAYSFEEAKLGLMPYASSIIKSYPFISAFGAQVNVHDVRDLEHLPFVKAVAAHTTVTVCGDGGSALSAAPLIREDKSGARVCAAVIDTGVRPHLDLMMPYMRVVRFEDFVAGRPQPYDDNGHGTAVAGLLLGNGLVSGGLHRGSAPAAELISLKAMNKKGEGSAFHILEAMQWIYENKDKYNIRVACMSFGTEPLDNNDPLVLGAEALWRRGITVVASAGNSGPADNTVTSPGICPEIITVGAAGEADGRIYVPDFSSRGRPGGEIKPELVAPGVDVSCCGITEHYVSLSGTSMAAPVVAGYCADILSVHPEYTPDKVKEILIENSSKLSFPSNVSGYGLAKLPDEYI
jgi:peptidase S8 and S53 subtilisin kexin sedolisin